jgi:hypothetical protein
MDAHEYLEKIIAEQYKRELDQEENVIRSLPFAAAALAVLSTIMVVVRSYVPTQLGGAYTICVWMLLGLFAVSIAVALWFLWRAMAAKRLQYLSPADELASYVTDLRNYYTALGLSSEQIEESVVRDSRTLMIEQYTIGTVHNQKMNGERLAARTRSFQSLIIALALAFVTVVVILADEAINGVGSGAVIHQRGK